MLNTRSALIRQLQAFFETHLRGAWRWYTAGALDELAPAGSIRLRAPDRHDKIPGRRQMDKNIVAVDFGDYAIQVSAPDEAPPLGKIVCFHQLRGSIEGPLDAATWDKMAAFIKERQ